MFTVPVDRRRGFTLLEIIIAVAILATMALSIYRFVQSNLVAIRVSSDAIASDARYDGLREVLTTQWQSLPPGKGALLGDAYKLSDRPRDEIRWVCSAGPGLMTRYAAGDFVVRLRLQSEKDSDRLDLGLLRKPKEDTALTDVHESWVALIDNVSSLQIRYFDSRLNVWVERWTDTGTLPRLVKVTVGRGDSTIPWEAIIPLGRTPL
ncbi:MAG TPA: prepilin-type N-terminal cleavage/methylation domain-containing protein [Chthoniobacterales bacterium]|jgi:prepilin-type N-terminal cleavage/methylation domain-containing protein|nr:prepilin-type N-terminal cleavage/methylation domain-containing protein [Chthoniobacterales bacterium]